MPEPVTATTTAGMAAVGIMALLVGWVGSVGADVMMVILASIAGTMAALSGGEDKTIKSYFAMASVGITLSLVLAWSIASLIAEVFPEIQGAYLPSIIALVISFGSDRMPKILNSILDKIEEKIGGTK